MSGGEPRRNAHLVHLVYLGTKGSRLGSLVGCAARRSPAAHRQRTVTTKVPFGDPSGAAAKRVDRGVNRELREDASPGSCVRDRGLARGYGETASLSEAAESADRALEDSRNLLGLR